MILLLGGTGEAAEVLTALQNQQLPFLVTAVTAYGGELAQVRGAKEVLVGTLDYAGLIALIQTRGIHKVVDATHPYAQVITALAVKACQSTGVRYIRYARHYSGLQITYQKAFWAATPAEAATLAFSLGNVVLTTTGSKNLADFISACGKHQRLIVRVLPDIASITACRKHGCLPQDIIAMQGPFSKQMNKTIFEEYGVEVLVTKDTGNAGGFSAKLAAAEEMQLPVVILQRPLEPANACHTVDDLLIKLKEETN